MPHRGGSTKKAKSGDTLGHATIRKLRKEKSKKKREGTGFHVADLDMSSNPLQSVTQASSMEEFMAVASLSNRSFIAERGQVSFVAEDTSLPGMKGGGGGPLAPCPAPTWT